MPGPLPLNFQVAPFPSGFTPVDVNSFARALAARMTATPFQQYGLFVLGTTAPASNQGPWLKDNGDGTMEWWYWNSVVGAYQPEGGSGGYFSASASSASSFIADGTWRTVSPFQDEQFDTLEIYTPASNSITINAASAGVWKFSSRFSVARVSGTGSASVINFRLLDTVSNTVIFSQVFRAINDASFQSAPVALTAGMIIRPQVNVTSTDLTDTFRVSASADSFLSGERLR